jgi:tetratricopeptide (TPR) repeat protein
VPGSGFQFEVYTTDDLATLKSAIPLENIDYRSRFSPDEQRAFEESFGAERLLVLGRTGLGKSRECVESFARLAEERGQAITIIRPRGHDFDRPRDADIPWSSAPKFLILFVDGIQDRSNRRAEAGADGYSEKTFNERLESVLNWMEERYGKSCKAVLTSLNDADTRDRLEFNAGLLQTFTKLELKPISPIKVRDFADAAAEYFGATLTSGAHTYIERKSDQTPAGIVVPLQAESTKEVFDGGELSFESLRDYSFTYPNDWKVGVYDRDIRPFPDRRVVFDVLAALRQLRIASRRSIVIDIAARLMPGPLPLWHRRNRAKGALRDLRTWITEHDGEVLCCRRYLEIEIDIAEMIAPLFDTLRYAVRQPIGAEIVSDLAALARIGSAYNQVENALSILQEAVRRRSSAPLYTAIAKLSSLVTTNDDDLVAAEAAVRADPQDATAYIVLSIMQSRHDLNDDALASARHATELAPNNGFTWLSLGVLLGKRRLYDESIDALTEASALNPFSASVALSLGIAYDRKGDRTRALEACTRATHLGPSDPDAWHSKGIVLDRMGDSRSAIAALEYAAQLDSSSKYLIALARSQGTAGLVEESRGTLERAIVSAGKDARQLALVSRQLSYNGFHKDAVEIAQAALAINRDSAPALVTFAYSLVATFLDDSPSTDVESDYQDSSDSSVSNAARRGQAMRAGIEWLSAQGGNNPHPGWRVVLSRLLKTFRKELANDASVGDELLAQAWGWLTRPGAQADSEILLSLAELTLSRSWPHEKALDEMVRAWFRSNSTKFHLRRWPDLVRALIWRFPGEPQYRQEAWNWLETVSPPRRGGAQLFIALARANDGEDEGGRLRATGYRWTAYLDPLLTDAGWSYEALFDDGERSQEFLDAAHKWGLNYVNDERTALAMQASFLLTKIWGVSSRYDDVLAGIGARIESVEYVGAYEALSFLKAFEGRAIGCDMAVLDAGCRRLKTLRLDHVLWPAFWITLFRQNGSCPDLPEVGLKWLGQNENMLNRSWPSMWLELEGHGAPTDLALCWLAKASRHSKWFEVWKSAWARDPDCATIGALGLSWSKGRRATTQSARDAEEVIALLKGAGCETDFNFGDSLVN